MRNWFLVVLLAIPLTACPQTPSTSGPHALKGVVVQEGAGEAVAGSTVKLFLGNTLVATSTTDAQGGFSFSNLPEGTFRLEVQKPGMAGSRVEGVRVPEVQSLRIIQKPAFDASATTTPPTLLITQNGTEPIEEQTFENSVPFRVQVDTTRDYVKPMRYIYVALGRTPGAAFLTNTTTSSRRVFIETEDTENQVLSGDAVAGLGSAAGERVYLEVVAYDFNNNRSHYLVPLTFKNTDPTQNNTVSAPTGVAATAITLGQAVGFYDVKAPLKLQVPTGRGTLGELALDPQAAPPGTNLYVEVRWCYTDTGAPPFAFHIERSTDGQTWTRVGTVGGGASASCPANAFNRPFYFRDASAELTPGQTYHYRVVAQGAGEAASNPSTTTPLPAFFAPLLSPEDEATGVSKTPDFTFGHPQLSIGADGAAYNQVLWDTLTGEWVAWQSLGGYLLFVEFGTGDEGNGIPQGEALVYGFPYGNQVVYTDTAGLLDPSRPNRVPLDVAQGTVTLPYNFDGFAALPELQALRTYAWQLYGSYAYKYEGGRVGAYSIQTWPSSTSFIRITQPKTQVFDFTTGE
ncbi:MAG: carboxypeptidase regulatory-like domain-containing protein [Thermaceae bacterium]